MANVVISLASALLSMLKQAEPAVLTETSVVSDLKASLVKEGSMIVPEALEAEAEAMIGSHLPTIFHIPDAALRAIALPNCDFAHAQFLRTELAESLAENLENLIKTLRTPQAAGVTVTALPATLEHDEPATEGTAGEAATEATAPQTTATAQEPAGEKPAEG